MSPFTCTMTDEDPPVPELQPFGEIDLPTDPAERADPTATDGTRVAGGANTASAADRIPRMARGAEP